jgi:hypothetical protein
VAAEGYGNVYRFARLSGLRHRSCLIRKDHVLWGAGRIEIPGKGGKINRVPITRAIAALLRSCWDDHPDFVFTFPARRTHDGRC